MLGILNTPRARARLDASVAHRPRRAWNLESLECRALLSTWPVSSLDDSGANTLRWAIHESNLHSGDDTIDFTPGLAGTITLDSALPAIGDTTGRTDIIGPGAGILAVSGGAARVLEISEGSTAGVSGLTLSGGHANDGGGVRNSGSLSLVECVIAGNVADRGGGIFSDGQLTLMQCTVADNSATGGYGGGLYLAGSYSTISGGSVEGNTATSTYNADAFGGGVFIQGGNVLISHVDLQGNQAVVGTAPYPYSYNAGGGAFGGAISMADSVVRLEGNTIASNEAIGCPGGGGVGDLQPFYMGGHANMTWWISVPIQALHDTYAVGMPTYAMWGIVEGGQGGIAQGGGVYVAAGDLEAVSNVFSDNQAVGGQGGIGAEGYIGYSESYSDSSGIPSIVPIYAVGVQGLNGWSSGNAISGWVSLLQNNAFSSSPYELDGEVPLVVSQFTVNQGEAQRSNISLASVQFNQNANVQSLIDSGAVTSAVQIVDAAGPVMLTADRYHYDASTFLLKIDLTVGGDQRTVLADGRYELRLDAALIAAIDYPAIRLNLHDTTPRPDRMVLHEFHRLEGDFNGDGAVTVLDRTEFLGHFGTKLGQSLYDYAFDLNGDGLINILDYNLWLKQRGKVLRL